MDRNLLDDKILFIYAACYKICNLENVPEIPQTWPNSTDRLQNQGFICQSVWLHPLDNYFHSYDVSNIFLGFFQNVEFWCLSMARLASFDKAGFDISKCMID